MEIRSVILWVKENKQYLTALAKYLLGILPRSAAVDESIISLSQFNAGNHAFSSKGMTDDIFPSIEPTAASTQENIIVKMIANHTSQEPGQNCRLDVCEPKYDANRNQEIRQQVYEENVASIAESTKEKMIVDLTTNYH